MDLRPFFIRKISNLLQELIHEGLEAGQYIWDGITQGIAWIGIFFRHWSTLRMAWYVHVRDNEL